MRKKYTKTIREQVKQTYGEIASEFDQTRKAPWQEFQHFLKYLGKNDKVLDLGCSNGRLYDFLKDKKVDYLGVDNNSVLLEKARENFPEAKFQLGDMVDLELSDKSFDVIFCIATFHHIPGRKLRRHAVSEMHRMLKRNGILILTVWNLFQWKYFSALLRSIFSFILHIGLKYAWNDLWVKWGSHPVKRYYHAFLPEEFRRYFKNKNLPAGKQGWKIEEFYFVRKGSRVKFWRSFNICLIVRKQK